MSCYGNCRANDQLDARTALLKPKVVDPDCSSPFKVYKVVVFGEPVSGKTELSRQISKPQSQFKQRYRTTIGVDFTIRTIPDYLLPPRDERTSTNAVVQFWDIGAHAEGFRLRMLTRQTDTCFVVVDPTSTVSLGDQLTRTLSQVVPYLDDDVTVLIVTSKADLQRCNPTLEDVRALVPDEHRGRILGCYSTSAADGSGCEELFADLCRHMITQQMNRARRGARPGAVRLPPLNEQVKRKPGCR